MRALPLTRTTRTTLLHVEWYRCTQYAMHTALMHSLANLSVCADGLPSLPGSGRGPNPSAREVGISADALRALASRLRPHQAHWREAGIGPCRGKPLGSSVAAEQPAAYVPVCAVAAEHAWLCAPSAEPVTARHPPVATCMHSRVQPPPVRVNLTSVGRRLRTRLAARPAAPKPQ